MRISTIILVLLFCTQTSKSQKLKDYEAINLNTKFKLELIKIDSSNYSCKVISKESFSKELDSDSARLLLDDSLKSNEIQGIFAIGKFGNSKSILLVIKSGHESLLDYKLFIDVKGKGRFKQTSTIQLYPNVPSIEMWPYYIYSIKITSLQSFAIEKTTYEPIKIDSTCNKNPTLNVSNGNKLFEQQLKMVKNGFLNSESFKLNKMLSFEDSIKSQDISLGHYYSLSEGIYPYFSNYIFGNPLQYRRVECPYFDGYSNYFYTKNEKDIKVVSFDWGEFKLSDWSGKEVNRTELRKVFETQYETIKEIITNVIGLPLIIEQEPDSGRLDTKWKSDNGISAYLFMFENYNEIRLYVYRN